MESEYLLGIFHKSGETDIIRGTKSGIAQLIKQILQMIEAGKSQYLIIPENLSTSMKNIEEATEDIDKLQTIVWISDDIRALKTTKIPAGDDFDLDTEETDLSPRGINFDSLLEKN